MWELLASVIQNHSNAVVKAKIEELMLPHLTPTSVNAVDNEGFPALALLAKYSAPLLFKALEMQPALEIVSHALHFCTKVRQEGETEGRVWADDGTRRMACSFVIYLPHRLKNIF